MTVFPSLTGKCILVVQMGWGLIGVTFFVRVPSRVEKEIFEMCLGARGR